MKENRTTPSITVFSLGGTIASTAVAGHEGVDVRMSGDDLVDAVPGVRDLASIEVRTFRAVPSGDLRMDALVELAAAIDGCFAGGSDAVVVTQGTDTLEETAFVLDLLVRSDRPVVLTGAMRNPTQPGADGPANLTAAVRVAASGLTTGMGAVVVFNDEIHAARLVAKRHTTSTATFGSPLAGPLGHVLEDRVRVLLQPPGRLTVRLLTPPAEAAVALVTIGLDDDGRLLRQVLHAGFDGLVVAAFGGGHVPASLVPDLEALARTIPVVLSSRTLAGPILRGTYGYPGGEIDLARRGLISAGALGAFHSRNLLQVLLMAGTDRQVIAAAFEDVLTAIGRRVIEAPPQPLRPARTPSNPGGAAT
ncbi:MAG TPA: asparaginase [Candidatus Dormibacteraeota bacterium]|jgi:L-asparaginase